MIDRSKPWGWKPRVCIALAVAAPFAGALVGFAYGMAYGAGDFQMIVAMGAAVKGTVIGAAIATVLVLLSFAGTRPRLSVARRS